MREPPVELPASEVLAVVRRDWDGAVTSVEHLPVGFGSHHWRADVEGSPRLFVTYDRVGSPHTLESLEDAYAGAIALARSGLEFVVAPLPTKHGRAISPARAGAVSCTPWLDGEVVGDGGIEDPVTAAANLSDLARLHRTTPPPALRHWTPIVGADFAARIDALLDRPWDSGPFGVRARLATAARSAAIAEWTRRYLALAERARSRAWVVTHGETHTANQLRTSDGIRFVDWESLLVAPRERDLVTLVEAGYAAEAGADRDMVELFDLQWRLGEIDQYTRWLSSPHAGTADDEIAFDGLREELARDPWWPAPVGGGDQQSG